MSNPQRYNVTAAEVLRSARVAQAELDNPVTGRPYREGIVSQKRQELELLTSYQMCPPGISPSAVATRLSDLKPSALKADVQQRFYSGEVMQAAACIANALYVDNGPYALASNERVRAFITDLRQMGAESVSGYALRANLGEDGGAPAAEGMFVVKAPRDPKNADELIHECMVALYGTNTLRSGEFACPNYAWVYGMFMCSSPYIDAETKKVASWCGSTDPNTAVAYAIYENVAPAKSFGEFALTATAQEILRNYIGDQLALREGMLRVGFTHYDDHDENTLMCERRKGIFYVKVRTSKGTEYMEYKDVIPTKIDYGMSHITLQDQKSGRMLHFGHATSEPFTAFGVYRDRSSPMHDAYKLLLMLLARLRGLRGKASNPNAYIQLSPLLTFFNAVESADTVLSNQLPTFYSLPWNEKVAQLNLDDWIAFCRAYCARLGMADPVKATLPPGAVVLQCAGDCLTFTQEMKAAGIDLAAPLPTPHTFLEFYDAYGALVAQPGGGAAAMDLAQRFGSQFTNAYTNELKRLQSLALDLKPFIIYRLPQRQQDLFNMTVLNQVKYSRTQAVKFLDAYMRMELAVKILGFTVQLYQVPATHPLAQLYTYYKAVLDQATRFRTSLVQALQQDIAFLEPWRVTPDATLDMRGRQERAAFRGLIAELDRRPDFTPYRWYWSTYPTVLTMI